MQADKNLASNAVRNNRQELLEQSHKPSLDSVAHFLLASAASGMRAHDLPEAMFWQGGYSLVRTIQRREDDLTAFLAGCP